jgi:ABC-type sulfate transport system substrate-binding protein
MKRDESGQDQGRMSDVVTKLTSDGRLILPMPDLRGQARVNYLRNRMRAKEAALVDRVVEKARMKGTLDNILERTKPSHNKPFTGTKVG